MDVAALLVELYGRIPPLAQEAVDGLDATQLTAVPGPGTNTIGWLIWHLTRVQDHHVAELLDTEQVWVDADWARRFGLDPDPSNTGYGHSAVEGTMLEGLVAPDLERVVDRRWDPPVTLGVRLVSIADDGLQHVGQAAYVRGLLSP
ncbi:MAG: DUF664 domain-containing protein [Actinobacteria bacterium]|nr:MAG: DUF664 domain-containing protein [Actinomycetota bacterium]